MNIVFSTPKYEISKYKVLNYKQEYLWDNYTRTLGYQNIVFSKLNKKLFKILKPKAVIISGGGNIYKLEKNKINKKRDIEEKKIISYCLKKNIPLICVCRGYQLIAADIYKEKLHKIDHHIRRQHFIKNGKKKLKVNSYHNYSILNLPDQFKTIFTCKKGTIELAVSNKPKILLCMFHPERKNSSQKSINRILKEFIDI